MHCKDLKQAFLLFESEVRCFPPKAPSHSHVESSYGRLHSIFKRQSRKAIGRVIGKANPRAQGLIVAIGPTGEDPIIGLEPMIVPSTTVPW